MGIKTNSDIETIFHFTVLEEMQGQRLDRFLSEQIEDQSRSHLQTLIKSGHVYLEMAEKPKTILEPKYKVKEGEVFYVEIPEPVDAEPEPEAIPLDVVYEDEALIVINKPSGLVVHPGPGNWTGTLVNALLAHCGENLSGIGGVRRPGIVHRIDKDTSGLMVVAKSDVAHRHLSDQFASHGKDGRMTRSYTALIWGKLNPTKGSINTVIGRHPHNRQKMAVVKAGGKSAVTHYDVLKVYYDQEGVAIASLVQCHLETGRTHQIRVHMTHIGHPLLGDPVYGMGFAASRNKLSEKARNTLDHLGRQALHATSLGFEHPITGEKMHFENDLPQDILQICLELE